MMSSLVQIAAVVLVCIMLLAGLYWHWRVFSLYRSLIEVKDKFGYDEFSFQFQSPYLTKQLRGPMFRDGLPPHLLAQVTAVRQHMRYVEFSAACCVIALFGLIIAGSRA
jgi:hypothetical protein